MMMHVMVAAKHDASAYFLSSAAVKPHCSGLSPSVSCWRTCSPAAWLWEVQ